MPPKFDFCLKTANAIVEKGGIGSGSAITTLTEEYSSREKYCGRRENLNSSSRCALGMWVAKILSIQARTTGSMGFNNVLTMISSPTLPGNHRVPTYRT